MTKQRDALLAQVEAFDRAPNREGFPALQRVVSDLLNLCGFTPDEMQEIADSEPGEPGALSRVVRKMCEIADQVEAFKPRRVDFSVKETAAAIRRALRAEFPDTKFSVVMSRGTGHGWLDVSWEDGPVPSLVDAVTGRFQSSYFDGMDDSNRSIAPDTVLQDGEIVTLAYSCKGANSSRKIGAAGVAWAVEMLEEIDPRDFSWSDTTPRDWSRDSCMFVGDEPLDYCRGYSYFMAPVDVAAGWARHYTIGADLSAQNDG